MKRLFDFTLAFFSLIFLLPILLIVSLIIKITSKGPVIFVQERSGKNRVPFKIYKFRSMNVSAPSETPKCELDNTDVHITKFGRFIRKSSIDELPQLLNILKGDMSFVGPRPLLCSENDVLDRRELYNANSIKPGLTGLAQISGRDILDAETKAKYDGEYVMKQSFFYDIKIIIKTFFYVLGAKGIKEGKK
ncbi:MAG: sugar transferase [bacterium]